LRLFIPGRPVPKGRPRGRAVTPKGGKTFVHFYTDDATVSWEDQVAKAALAELTRISLTGDEDLVLPFQGRCLVQLRFNFERPKSTPKSVQYPVKSRTDVDNLAKAVLDALQNARLIINDNIVTDLTVCKRYADEGHPEGVEIDITHLG
jgi:Holliday junction resolvase RusA-like endonuclease